MSSRPPADNVGRSAKHHVFERVREPRFSGRFVERSETVPHRGLHDGRRPILHDDHREAVLQRVV